MMWNYIRFDFGESFFRNTPVLELIKDKLPVSISLGCGSRCFPTRSRSRSASARRSRTARRFDVWTSGVDHRRLCGPGFLFAHPADRALCRRFVLELVPAARPASRTISTQLSLVAEDRSTISGTWRCR
jgi:hypothetical protein